MALSGLLGHIRESRRKRRTFGAAQDWWETLREQGTNRERRGAIELVGWCDPTAQSARLRARRDDDGVTWHCVVVLNLRPSEPMKYYWWRDGDECAPHDEVALTGGQVVAAFLHGATAD